MGAFRLVEEPQQDFKEKVKEGALETIRHPARIGSSIASTVVGLPGDIAFLLNKYAAGPIYEKISGEKATPYEQTALGKILPTSEQHKEALQDAAPKLLKPRNKIEAFGDAIIEDATSLFLPGKAKIPFKNAATKALAISTGANLAGETLKDLSGDEKKGAYAKMGTMFLTSLISGPKAAKVVGDLYNKAEKAIPKGASINVQSEAKKISRLQDKILAGRNYNALDANEKFVVDEAQHVLDLIKNGRIIPQQAWAQKRSLNTKLNEHLFKSPDRKAASRAKKLALDINKQLNSILKRYGNKNSQFAKNFQPAERAFETLAKSNSLQNWIKNKLKYNPLTPGLLHVFGPSLYAGITAASAPLLPAYQTAKILYRLKDPVLRSHYVNAIKAAGENNAQVFNRELEKLDKKMQKTEPKTKFRLIED